ncbi:MAG: alpha/beta hydrolase, partial [Verrucomicrobiota bacterium]|nr:alpha/beta hydrolase [Verrucomicrobiota bacterium]
MPTGPRIISLAGGGCVAVQEYGGADGVPVFFFHGWPSSRTMAELTDDAACELGVRIISIDRPGIRDSTFQIGRTLLDWPPLLREVARQLQLDRFRVLALSGGAPYAYVAGWAMPEAVEAIAVASGAPPIAELTNRTGLLHLYNRMLVLHQRRPGVLRAMFRAARPFA